jgi:hypothetical protein
MRVRKIAKNEFCIVSIRMEQLGSHWTDSKEMLCLSFFSKLCREKLNLIKIRQEQRALYTNTFSQS